jgi:NAD(P)-dependent dehydrogenase (short-subunit alcohol dehydrogenase family)
VADAERRIAPDHTDRPLAELIRLDGRVAVVTGAARGLGAQIVSRLAEAGADVLAGDLDVEGVEATAAQITGRWGGRVVGVALDVADPPSIEAAADRAVAEFGRLDVWVNNAGISTATGSALDVTPEFIDRMFAVNARGTYLGAREAAKRMPDGGVVVNGRDEAKGQRCLEEMAPLLEAGVDVAARAAANPLGRIGVPDDVARVVLFAASDMAAFMTGSTLAVDAGRLA